MSSTVAKRYARAFFNVAGEEKKFEDNYMELHLFANVMEKNKSLREFLLNPIFAKDEKKNVLDQVINKLHLSATTSNFLRLLVDKGRVGNIGEIEDDYRKLMDNAIGIARVHVKTAFPLAPDLSGNLQRALESLTGKKVVMSVEEDSSLLGGIVVQSGDRIYDGSIKTQLNTMRRLLGEEI